jgi:energy-converting hydrogenase B subunit I
MKGKEQGMSLIVKTIACIVSVPAITFGLYVILHGHLTPGGGFPGGAVIATVVALFLVSFGKERLRENLSKRFLSALESIGLIIFIGLAFMGLSSTFFRNFLANSGEIFGMSIPFGANAGYLGTGGTIPLMNLAVGLEVFAALSLILVLMFISGGDSE